jgi:hypothetical protein
MRNQRFATRLLAAAIAATAGVAAAPRAAAQDNINLVSAESGKCLQPINASSEPGVAIVQVTCNGSAAQQWTATDVEGTIQASTPWQVVHLVNGASHLCLDARGEAVNGTPIQQWPCNSITNEDWTLQETTNLLWLLSSGISKTWSHCVRTPGVQDGLAMSLQSCANGSAMLWSQPLITAGQTNLTGSWLGNDNGIYYIRQIGNDVWWAGLSTGSPAGIYDLHKGLVFTSVFHGTLKGNTLAGSFVDVPKGQQLTSGPLSLTVQGNGNALESEVPGAYRATSWARFIFMSPRPDPFGLFQQVMKNQNAIDDHSLLDNLKPAKNKPVSILGRITNAPWVIHLLGVPITIGDDPYVVKMGYPPTAGRTYSDFICLGPNKSPPDGDLTFDIHVDRGNLDQQIGFWGGSGWETSHNVSSTSFENKLNVSNMLHEEVIMYGGTTECHDSGSISFLAPGWQQNGSLGALFNGVPIDGQVAFSGPPDPADPPSSNPQDRTYQVASVLGVPLGWNSFVRVNGILALDCGHEDAWYDPRPCKEDDASYQNQEIHPVYSIDLIQNFSQARPFANLSGVWAASDAGTYYLRQDGNTVWWLGMSVDEGQTFANVFQGTLQNNQISGSWADVPLGQTLSSGAISLASNLGPLSIMMDRQNETGGFSGNNWQKLYDAGGRTIIIVFDQAEFESAAWPETSEELEIQAGPTRVNVKPQNLHIVKGPNGNNVMQANISARIRVDAPELGGLRMSAQFAGYRADWSLSEADFKSGVHVQPMTSPPVVRTGSSKNEKGNQMAKKTIAVKEAAAPSNRDPAMAPVPPMTIHYHVEPADPSGRDRLPK